MDDPETLGHWRTESNEEADVVVEHDDGRVIAFGVNANERVRGPALKGIRKLRGILGDRFLAGVALPTGSRTYASDDRIHVCPTDRLWQSV